MNGAYTLGKNDMMSFLTKILFLIKTQEGQILKIKNLFDLVAHATGNV